MEVSITVGSNGDESILVVSTIEDLLHDYQHFRNAAAAASSEVPAFEQKRYLRAALMFFVAHCSAVVDSWCRKELEKEGKEQDEQKRFLRRSVDAKCEYLSKRASIAGLQKPTFGFKHLRNRIAHVANGDDLAVFEELSTELLKEAETDMYGWFDLIGGALGHRRFTPSEEVLQDLSEGERCIRSCGTEPSSGT